MTGKSLGEIPPLHLRRCQEQLYETEFFSEGQQAVSYPRNSVPFIE
jgi:hypothetical protein